MTDPSDTIKDGGPAYPGQMLGQDGLPCGEAWSGISMRAYIATAALQNMWSGVIGREQAPIVAEAAVWVADALIAELAKDTP